MKTDVSLSQPERARGAGDAVVETGRLLLRRMSVDDAAFMLELLNDPAWLRYIGDRGVRTLEEARDYIRKGPVHMYARVGFGLYLTELKEDGAPIGICGLLQRDSLPDVDIGFALLPRFRSKGYASEAAAATMAYGRNVLRLKRIVAITSPDNDDSARLLEKLGFRFERLMTLGDDPRPVRLFAADLSPERAGSEDESRKVSGEAGPSAQTEREESP